MAAARGAGRGVRRQRRGRDLSRTSSRPRPTGALQGLARPVHLRHGRGPGRRPLRHQGLADLALDRLLLRRDRDPARRRGDPARRDRRGALHRHRRLGQPRNPSIRFSLLSALSTQNDPPEGAAKPFSKNRDGFVMGEGGGGAGARERRERARRAAPRSSATCSAAARRATASTAPARARTARRSSRPSGRRSTMPGSRPTTIDYVNAHGTGRPRTTRWSRWAAWRCSASA